MLVPACSARVGRDSGMRRSCHTGPAASWYVPPHARWGVSGGARRGDRRPHLVPRMGVDRPGTPLLLLHGGPGAASYYIEPLAERLAAGRPTVVYDQLGCGRSEQPDDTSLWTVDRSVQELDQVREALGLGPATCSGSRGAAGWRSSTCLASRAASEQLILASTSASIPQFMAEARRLIEALPAPAWAGASGGRREGGVRHARSTRRRSTSSISAISAGPTRGRRSSSRAGTRWTGTRSI